MRERMKKSEEKKPRHKWNFDDVCEKCGLKRRFARKTPDGFVFGGGAREFYVDGEWKFAKVDCKEIS